MATKSRTQTVRIGGKTYRVQTTVKTSGNRVEVKRTIR